VLYVYQIYIWSCRMSECRISLHLPHKLTAEYVYTILRSRDSLIVRRIGRDAPSFRRAKKWPATCKIVLVSHGDFALAIQFNRLMSEVAAQTASAGDASDIGWPSAVSMQGPNNRYWSIHRLPGTHCKRFRSRR